MMKVALLMTLALGGCVAEPPADSPDSPDSTEIPRISANALSPTTLAAGLVTTAVLNSSNAATMGATSQARKVLSFAVGCALDATQSISFNISGTTFTATGAMGVAPAWTSRALTTSEAAWVSACVVSRVNLTSALVMFSARGANAGYDTTIGEVADYQTEEGAFWGNVFTDLGSITGYACNGADQAASDSFGDLPLRECAEWNGVAGSNLSPCGYHYAGLCSAVCSTTNTYAGCSFQGGTPSAEVVTSFLYGSPP